MKTQRACVTSMIFNLRREYFSIGGIHLYEKKNQGMSINRNEIRVRMQMSLCDEYDIQLAKGILQYRRNPFI